MNDTYHIPPPCVFGAASASASASASSSSSSCRTLTGTRNPRKKRTRLITVMDDDNRVPLKAKHYKKPDPGAPKITRPCTECGKKFWSWKALFGHMRCHPERQWRGINPPPNLRPQQPRQPQQPHQHFHMSQEDHEVAASLLLLASGTVTDNMSGNVTVLTAECPSQQQQQQERFECSSCKKVFGSHQALGGHRASHKNVKGCFAITKSDGEEDMNMNMKMMNMQMVVYNGGPGGDMDQSLGVGHHQCSICLRVFSTGQALGGHKRCHWEKGDTKEGSASAVDLNLPALSPFEDDHCSSSHLTLDLRLGL